MKAIIAADGKLVHSNYERPRASDYECLIRIHFAGINRADLLQVQGLYPHPPGASEILGLEFSGEIVEVGRKVTGFKKGDHVFSIVASGGYGEYVTVHFSHLMKVPDNVSMEQAGGLAEVFITAYQSLFHIGKIRKGERILIHAGASGVGSAAIQMTKSVDCEVICTASAGKHEYCRNLGADRCIDYKKENYAEILSDIDMVLDLVGGSYFQKNIQVMAVEGRMVMLGFMGGVMASEVNVAGLVTKRLKIFGSTLRARDIDYKSELVDSFASHFIADWVFPFKPNIDHVFDFKDATLAHKYMKENKNKGKILLRMHQDKEE